VKPTIRVLVVDDSALVRQILTHVLGDASHVEVVGVARNGVEAVAAVRALEPDVVTLDIQMPEMDGMEALRLIVRDSTARVVMLTSVDDPETTFQALEAGATDFIVKPREGLATSIDRLSVELVRAIKAAYAASPEKRQRTAPPSAPTGPAVTAAAGDPERVVCIAASTGGPLALDRVFAGLQPDLSAAFLVVQHLPVGFAASLAARLSKVAGFPVSEAQDGMRVMAGQGYVAPYGTHMRICGESGRPTRIELVSGPSIHGLIPAADPLFESVAESFGKNAVGVVLTGMGSDAAVGLLAVREAGGQTIAQDEETSVVWGMPGSAVKIGAASCVAPLERVAVEIRRALRNGGKG
jgi:two-component system, chemotaxis family, protein-glutamate methylesterase/glutaminase